MPKAALQLYSIKEIAEQDFIMLYILLNKSDMMEWNLQDFMEKKQ